MDNILQNLGIDKDSNGVSTGQKSWKGSGRAVAVHSPVDGKTIGTVNLASAEDYARVKKAAHAAFKVWRKMPAPQRGEIVRQYGDKLRQHKQSLGSLVSYEMGKSLQEGLGEVQEMIDICDFAVGLSRQLYGLQMHSERPNHRMFEQWHPLGIVGIISAFNFPVAVWSWNTALAWVCGNVCLWKPSEKTPFSAIACQKIFAEVLKENDLPEGISSVVVGDREVGELMSNDPEIPLVSATGSTRMGKSVSEAVSKRLGKMILELGGNNAIIVTENADLKQAIQAIVFGAVGTAGQRCTTTRRLIIHESRYDELKNGLVNAYEQIRIGDPLDQNNHMGPLIDTDAVDAYNASIKAARSQGGNVLNGDAVLDGAGFESGCYVKPTIVEATPDMAIVKHETFAPILYLLKYNTIQEAIDIQNNVPQGLSSSIFTLNMREAEAFLSVAGSDCGIANVNIGTSGAEIGGAFGGEKETGGGRESGSDAWKAYMRRQTCTVNYGADLPLAQGISFDF
ncbi:MAG: aldehyde dehydrogenase family protein [Bacteroidota bacterium]